MTSRRVLVLGVFLIFSASPPARPAAAREPDGPAVEDYRASADDFEVLEQALSGVRQISAQLFPDGDPAVDIVLQDTSDFFVYSKNFSYPYKKVKRWGDYQVYRFPHRRRPVEHEMWGCAAGLPDAIEVEDRRILAERSIRCAPWGSFRRAQERKRGIYRFREGYLATLIHEHGHVYEEFKSMDPSPLMTAGADKARDAALPEGIDREEMSREVFAQACELLGSRELYPDHYARLLKEKRRGDAHAIALGIALDLVAPKKRSH